MFSNVIAIYHAHRSSVLRWSLVSLLVFTALPFLLTAVLTSICVPFTLMAVVMALVAVHVMHTSHGLVTPPDPQPAEPTPQLPAWIELPFAAAIVTMGTGFLLTTMKTIIPTALREWEAGRLHIAPAPAYLIQWWPRRAQTTPHGSTAFVTLFVVVLIGITAVQRWRSKADIKA